MEEEQKRKEDTYLEYKQHSGFFKQFDYLRSNYLEKHYDFFTSPTENKKIALTGALIGLIDWTRSQLSKHLNVEEIKTKIFELQKQRDNYKVYTEYDNIFGEISNAHEEAELIPKVHSLKEDENSKWWKDEEHKAMKEAKKAFYDIILVEQNGRE